jgi:hypothetical protein
VLYFPLYRLLVPLVILYFARSDRGFCVISLEPSQTVPWTSMRAGLGLLCISYNQTFINPIRTVELDVFVILTYVCYCMPGNPQTPQYPRDVLPPKCARVTATVQSMLLDQDV